MTWSWTRGSDVYVYGTVALDGQKERLVVRVESRHSPNSVTSCTSTTRRRPRRLQAINGVGL
jgi:hypothetical protein